jgi:inhibitor of KinA
MDWVRYGPAGLMFRFASTVGDESFAKGCEMAAELERLPPPGMIEFVPAFTTMLVTFETGEQATSAAPELARRLERCTPKPIPATSLKTIPVVYDGPDIRRVADLHGLTVNQVEEIHAATTYKVYMLGFAPGFPYLGDLDPRLHTPRLPSPRTRVPAGSVAIGGSHTGIYSVESPGGWNIIGHTTVKLFDAASQRDPIFHLRHGDRLRFVRQSTHDNRRLPD